MDTQFEIHSQLEKKHYVELYRWVWKKRWIWIGIYVVAGILGLLLYLANERITWIVYGCAMILYAVWVYFRPWQVAGKRFKENLAFESGEKLCSTTKFGDEIVDESVRERVVVPYDKIKKIHITKDMIFLMDIRKMVLILEKDGFTKGTVEEFLPFIQNKCPQLILPKW